MTKLRCVDGDTLAEKQLNLSQKPGQGLSVSQNQNTDSGSAAASPEPACCRSAFDGAACHVVGATIAPFTASTARAA